MKIVPLEPRHLLAIRPQPRQRAFTSWCTAELSAVVHLTGPSWSLVNGDNVVGVGGCITMTGDPPLAWSVLAGEGGACMLTATRAVRRFLELWPVVETVVQDGHLEGERWAWMLGFRPLGRPTTRGRDVVQSGQAWLRIGTRHGQ